MGKLPLLYSVYATISALMMSYLVTSHAGFENSMRLFAFQSYSRHCRRFEHVPRYMNPHMNILHSRLFLFTMEIFQWPLFSGGAPASALIAERIIND